MKEVSLCSGPPGSCCAKVEIYDSGAVTIKADTTDDEVYLTANEWAVLKDKIKRGVL